MLDFMYGHFEVRNYHYNNYFCKNIKVHHLPISNEQMSFWFDNMDKIYYGIIEQLIDIWNTEHDNNKIYSMGRSGGWLTVDNVDNLGFTRRWQEEHSEFEEKWEDETQDEYDDRLYPLRNTFEILWEFQKWYDDSYEEVIGVLNEMMKEDGGKIR